MRVALPLYASIIFLSACAFPNAVTRMSIDYNTVVSSTANELTLLNIMRARERLPLHYTAFNRISGTFTVRANASINVPLKGSSLLRTTRGQTQIAPTGTTTLNEQSDAVTEGLEVYTPTIGGEVSSTPSMEVQVLDTQAFYNGILGQIPFTTIENYINQGFDNELLIHLFVERIDFRAAEADASFAEGALVHSLVNRPGGETMAEFAGLVACQRLGGTSRRRASEAVAPLSRITMPAADGSARPLGVEDLVALIGDRLDLDLPVPENPAGDRLVSVRRTFPAARVATFQYHCSPDGTPSGTSEGTGVPAQGVDELTGRQPVAQAEESGSAPAGRGAEPGRGDDKLGDPVSVRILSLFSSTEPVSAGEQASTTAKVEVTYQSANGVRTPITIKTNVEVLFRSTEGVIRHVGEYLRLPRGDAYLIGGRPLFTLANGRSRDALVSTQLLGQRYSVDSSNQRREMAVIAIIQQLINLHKNAAERPSSVPVQVINN